MSNENQHRTLVDFKLENCLHSRRHGPGNNDTGGWLQMRRKIEKHPIPTRTIKCDTILIWKRFRAFETVSFRENASRAVRLVMSEQTEIRKGPEKIYATVTMSHSMKHQPRFSQIAVNINLLAFILLGTLCGKWVGVSRNKFLPFTVN